MAASSTLSFATPIADAADAAAQELSFAGVWQADQLSDSGQGVLRSGHARLDAELPGGGWPLGAITEILQTQTGSCEWRLLCPALRASQRPLRRGQGRQAVLAGRPLLLLGPPHWPHVPALTAQGLAPQQLLLVQVQQPAQRLWVMEQALRCTSLGMVLCWLPQARPEQVRRLQLAARSCDYPVFLFRPLAARHESSAATLRLTLRQHSALQLQLQIIKRRGPLLEQPLLLDAPAAGLTPLLSLRQRPRPAPDRFTAASDVLDRAVPQIPLSASLCAA